MLNIKVLEYMLLLRNQFKCNEHTSWQQSKQMCLSKCLEEDSDQIIQRVKGHYSVIHSSCHGLF